MNDENHATKEDLRYVENRLEGKVDSVGREVKRISGSIDGKFADKAMVKDLHKKYWDINKEVQKNSTNMAVLLGQMKVWMIVGGVLISVLSAALNYVIQKYL